MASNKKHTKHRCNGDSKSNFYIKEIKLDSHLNLISDSDDKPIEFSLRFFYDKDDILNEISLSSNKENSKDVVVSKPVIEHFEELERADSDKMEALRSKLLKKRDLVVLKRYLYECIRYV